MIAKAPWIIFDIDGTLANVTHRLRHIVPNPDIIYYEDAPFKKDWDSWNALMHLDLPKLPVIQLCKDMFSAGYNIALVTGRQECYRKETQAWLLKHYVPYDAMHMRATGDKDHDWSVKERLYDAHFKNREVAFVVDDRQCVVDMWRRNGLTCLQCQKGDY